eukprot:1159033-Pelagomonas_calceolata.AAC.2
MCRDIGWCDHVSSIHSSRMCCTEKKLKNQGGVRVGLGGPFWGGRVLGWRDPRSGRNSPLQPPLPPQKATDTSLPFQMRRSLIGIVFHVSAWGTEGKDNNI